MSSSSADPSAGRQLELPSWTPEELRDRLEAHTGMALELTITDNARCLVRMSHGVRNGARSLRLHHMFLQAPSGVVRALGDWLVQPRRKASGEKVDAFLRAHAHLVRKPPTRVQVVRTRGQVHDLEQLAAEVNATHFDGAIGSRITWGRRSSSRKRRRTMRFGSYHYQGDVIRIHPALDQAFVPDWVVRFVIFHEMLHAYLGIRRGDNGRREYHGAEFKAMEVSHPDYERVRAWERDPENLERLMRR